MCSGNFQCLSSQTDDLLLHGCSLKTCRVPACEDFPVGSTSEGDKGHKAAGLSSSLPAASLWPAGRNTGKPPANRSPRAGGVLPPREFVEPPPSLLLVPLEPLERRGKSMRTCEQDRAADSHLESWSNAAHGSLSILPLTM